MNPDPQGTWPRGRTGADRGGSESSDSWEGARLRARATGHLLGLSLGAGGAPRAEGIPGQRCWCRKRGRRAEHRVRRDGVASRPWGRRGAPCPRVPRGKSTQERGRLDPAGYRRGIGKGAPRLKKQAGGAQHGGRGSCVMCAPWCLLVCYHYYYYIVVCYHYYY